jgi:hypothetical protein
MRLCRYFLMFLLLHVTCALAEDATPNVKANGKTPTRLLIRAGMLVSADGAPIQLRSFEADIADGVDRKSSEHVGNKIVLIKKGDAFISNDALGRLLTGKLKDHNMEDIKVTNDRGKVKITGKAKKGITVPFTIEGPVSLTDKGLIRLEMAKVNVAHLPKGVVDLFGIDPEKLAGDGTVKGVSMEKNAIAFDPDLLWGLPVHGQVTRLVVQNNGLMLIFGGGQRSNHAAQLSAKNLPSQKH